MDRRTFICVASGAILLAGATLFAMAQAPAPVRRIGLLSGGAPPPDAEIQQGLWASLRDLGWIEGQNLKIERRHANGRTELLLPFAEELVRLNVEMIVTNGTDAAIAAKNATTSIAIVITNAGDPVRTGLVASLARPGGNITGFSIAAPEVDAKLLSLLHELIPTAQRVGVLVNPTNPIHGIRRKENEQVYRSLGMQPIVVEVTATEGLDSAVAEVRQQRGQALIVLSDSLFLANAVPIMRAALRHALPTMVEGPLMLEAGGLISYAVNVPEQRQRVAALIDKILRGAKPAELPIEQPTKFDLGVNLKTAKALGITVPKELLLRADEVIQ